MIHERQLEEFFDEEMSAYEDQLSNALLTMLKSCCKGVIEISSGDSYHVFDDCRVMGYHDGIIRIMTKDNQEKKFPFEDVIRCNYYMEREFE